jgi:hypothetical protein
MRGIVVGAALGIVMLAGCSKPADSTNAANTAAAVSNDAATVASSAASTASAAANTAAVAAAGPAGPIQLSQLPAPTAGQWTEVSIQDGGPPQTSSKCLSGKPIDPNEGAPAKCASITATRTATGGFVVIADCPSNSVDAKLSLAGEGDFTKSFTTDATMTMTGGPGASPMTMKNHTAYTYVGPTCSK